MEPMVRIENLTFGYKRKSRVYEDFSLDIPTGQVVGLLGKNGTGKSTLLYLICAMLRPDKGRVLMKGVDTGKRLPQTLADMFIVPEEYYLPKISLKQYVALNAPFYPKFSNEQLEACLRDFDLPSDVKLGELSMGQKKKAFISFALAANTSLLLMDEPTNGLDIPSKSQFRKVIASGMSDEKSIIISTHQVRDIDKMLEHLIMIDGNNVLLDHSVNAILDKLYFSEQSMNEPVDDALFVQPSVYGNSVISLNRSGEESPLNLELLFNAVLAERDKFQTILKQED